VARSRRRRQHTVGLLPRLGRSILSAGRWVIHHPQPLILCVLLAIASWALWSYTQRAEAFRVTQIQLPPQSSLRVPESLIGQNLWDVDIDALAADFAKQQPALKTVRVVRQLPNVLRIETIPRVAIAQVRLDLPAALAAQAGRWYPVDGDGFVLQESSDETTAHLIRLEGLAGSAIKVGRENTNERLRLALRVLEKLRHTPAALARRLTHINVTNPQEIRLVIDGETEVHCGSEEELDAHVHRLVSTLKVIGKQQLSVRYIDVRFREPVISPRT